MTCCLFQVADGGADGPGLQLGPLLTQPAEAKLRLAAALAAHQLVPFIQHHRVQTTEQLLRLRVAEQQRQGFRCGHQNLWRRFQLFRSFTTAAVAIADANAQWPLHRFDRFADGKGEITAQSPERGEIQQPNPFGRALVRQHPGDWSHHRSEGLAGSCGHLDQATATLQVGLPGGLLKGQWCPALTFEPSVDGIKFWMDRGCHHSDASG